MATMREMFRQHHSLSDEEKAAVWKDCEFVLDANSLLNIYRYADATRKDLFRVLEAVRERLWVPHQAGVEFYRRRLEVISEQRGKYDELTSELELAVSRLRGGAFAKSAFLNIQAIEAIIQPAVNEAMALVKGQAEKHPDLSRSDPYLERLVEIVGERVGQAPTPEIFAERCSSAQVRIEKKQPPGYKDGSKLEPDRYGDILIWFEMLDHGKATSKPIVFITDDDKEDWWVRRGGEKLGPRPELRQEMHHVAGVEFHIYNPASFLARAGDPSEQPVSKSSVDDATEVSREIRARALASEPSDIWRSFANAEPPDSERGRALALALPEQLVKRIVADFLAQGGANVVHAPDHVGAPDLIVYTSDGILAVNVWQVTRASRLQRLRDALPELADEAISMGMQPQFVIVAVSDSQARQLVGWWLSGGIDERAVPVTIGYAALNTNSEPKFYRVYDETRSESPTAHGANDSVAPRRNPRPWNDRP